MIYFSDILNTVLPMLLAFAISTVTGHFLIPQLRRLKVQQTERGEGPQSHLGKSGTPNMGGLMIIAAFTVTGLIFAVKDARILPVVFMTLGFGLVGFVDDFIKVTKKRSEGLTVRQKMAFQILISLSWLVWSAGTDFHRGRDRERNQPDRRRRRTLRQCDNRSLTCFYDHRCITAQ